MEKYDLNQRMEIGRRICEGKMTVAQAAVFYDVNFYTARNYLRMYKAHAKAAKNSGAPHSSRSHAE